MFPVHKHILDLIPFYLTGKISDTEMTLVRDHLAGCKACQRSYVEWQSISKEVYRNAESWSQPLPVLDKGMLQRQNAKQVRGYSIPAVLWTGITVLMVAVLILANQYQKLLSPMPTSTVVIFPPPTSTIVILPTLKGTIRRDPPPERCVAQNPSIGLVNIYGTPSPSSQIVAQLYPGEYLVVIETNSTGWYKILGRDSLPVGWVWNRDAIISGTGCHDISTLPAMNGTSIPQP
jgi:hypothetical protein